MSNWQERLEKHLEPILRQADPRPQISAYHDMPYAIFRYPPERELAMREAIFGLRTRLENTGKDVIAISLAERLSVALDREKLTMARITQAEQRTGTARMIDTVSTVLGRRQPLDELVAEKLPADADPTRPPQHAPS